MVSIPSGSGALTPRPVAPPRQGCAAVARSSDRSMARGGGIPDEPSGIEAGLSGGEGQRRADEAADDQRYELTELQRCRRRAVMDVFLSSHLPSRLVMSQ